MAAELGLLFLTQHQELAHQPPSWMTNPRRAREEDDSWEVRAFAEDTSSALGTTWPPRSYTCTFCRREFRSAQALGGHMNVHRRDRARLHQSPPGSEPMPSSNSFPSPIFPTQELVGRGGIRLLYPFAASSAVFRTMPAEGCLYSPSTLPSIAPNTGNDTTSPCSQRPQLPMVTEGDPSSCHFRKIETLAPLDNERDASHVEGKDKDQDQDDMDIEEVDLELRLGQRPSPRVLGNSPNMCFERRILRIPFEGCIGIPAHCVLMGVRKLSMCTACSQQQHNESWDKKFRLKD